MGYESLPPVTGKKTRGLCPQSTHYTYPVCQLHEQGRVPWGTFKKHRCQVPPSRSDAVGLNDPNICLSFPSSLENSDALAGLRTIRSRSTYRYRDNYLRKEDRRSFHQHPGYFLIFRNSALFGE